jgi:DNA-binding MarR family transcriptional regulator
MRRADALDRIERSISRISRVGTNATASRTRAARAGVAVSTPGMGVLGALADVGPQRVSAIAARTGMVGPLVSREVGVLEAAGLVERRRDPLDGRAVVVSLTDKGEDAHRRMRQASVDMADETLGSWRASDLTQLALLLDRLADDLAPARATADGRLGSAHEA